MGYEVVKFQNESKWSGVEPTIVVTKDDPNWETIYQTWINGKNPTDSKLWKKGVFAICEEKKESK